MGDAMKTNGAFIGQDVFGTPLIGKLRLHIQGYVDKEDFSISPLKREDVILGAPWFDRLAASIKFPERKISFKLKKKDMYINAQQSGSTIPFVNDQDFDKSIKSSICTTTIYTGLQGAGILIPFSDPPPRVDELASVLYKECLPTQLRGCLLLYRAAIPASKLATSDRQAEVLEEQNRHVAVAFYEALAAGDASRLHSLLASSDLEWSFHGPACDQHLMKFLTGAVSQLSFEFTPVRVRQFGYNVFVEGQGKAGSPQESKFWVHVWTMKHGKIIQLREYFNTSLTVLKPSSYYTLWQSQLGSTNPKSSPSLILAM
ncbi:hypothetical protein L7F22_050838 [Adiantum nelumboides]|nr:hypothetical protein [Adiantum nelumboides]